jgi:hypothetical protein
MSMITLNLNDPVVEWQEIPRDSSHFVHVTRLLKDQAEYGPKALTELESQYNQYIIEMEEYRCRTDIDEFERRLGGETKSMCSCVQPPVPSFLCSEAKSLIDFHRNKNKCCIVEPEFQPEVAEELPDHTCNRPPFHRRSQLFGHLSIPYLYPDLRRKKELYDAQLRADLIQLNAQDVAKKQKQTRLLSKVHRQKFLENGTSRVKRSDPIPTERPLSSLSASAVSELREFTRRQKEERSHKEEEAKKEEGSTEENLFRATFAGKARPGF